MVVTDCENSVVDACCLQKVEIPEGESGDDYVPETDTEGSGSIYVEERPKPPKQHPPKQEVTTPPRVQVNTFYSLKHKHINRGHNSAIQ
jgi:hypothetical protein